ncbi:hypothetical protein BC835DRAFT_250845 [Cytidiella melzeri]|nr:hypothetical protein BC835DRAFT_250845 [Cytidiella melzeri]
MALTASSETWGSQPFTIVSSSVPPTSPAITSPNASTTWVVNSTVDITFDVSQVKNENGTLRSIDLFTSTGKYPVANLATNFQSNTGSVAVTVPNVANGTYRIIITGYNAQETWGSQPFTIVSSSVPPTSPAITSPNASTTWVVNSTVDITFDVSQVKNENGTLRSIDLFTSTGKFPVANLATNFQSNTGSVAVTVPNVANGTYRIIITGYNAQETWGSQPFSIVLPYVPVPPTPTYPITAPDATTTWVVGGNVTINWDTTQVENGTLKSVGLYSSDGGLAVKTFATGIESTGSLGVVVPYVSAGSYRVIIQGYSGKSYGSAPFTITGRGPAPPVSVTSTTFFTSSTSSTSASSSVPLTTTTIVTSVSSSASITPTPQSSSSASTSMVTSTSSSDSAPSSVTLF